ncbi:MAG: glycosyltransferase, partial [SAR324 cluster bacterium]|nr:glycosyltransferase [SAR324 cluster bacterium]
MGTAAGGGAMIFVIYCPGMPFHGGTLEQGRSLGGSESAAYYLARELARQGHQVTVFTQISREEAGMWEGVRYCAAGPVTPQTPLGADFQWYAAMTPHDVLILQRVPNGFQHRFAAKVNLWWSHDLALKRFQPLMSTQLWNVDRLLAVSEFHKGQMAQVYNFPADRIAVVRNGVDPALFDAVPLPDSPDGEREAARKIEQGLLVYSSRPERGLELLVGPGGVMERLLASDPELTLRVAGYENTAPNLRPFYEFLWGRCQELPNVELAGPLSKKELADLMRAAWLHLYPTAFEEVSCISVMESQAAGTPVITSNLAALPETLRDGGAVLLEPELPRLAERCVSEIAALRADRERWERLHRLALHKGRQFRWGPAAETVLTLAEAILREKSASPGRLARHLLRHSDILACRRLIAAAGAQPDGELSPVKGELERHYGFQERGTFGAHYEAFAQWQNERGIDQGHDHPERLLAIPRFRVVEELVGRLPQGARVLDYGCGQGHFSVVLAEKYPHLEVLGIDVAPGAIAVGQRHLETKGLTNLRLLAGQTPPGEERFDLVLACEVLEHVPDPGAL